MSEVLYKIVSDGSDYEEKCDNLKKAILDLIDSQIGRIVSSGRSGEDVEKSIQGLVLARVGNGFDFTLGFPFNHEKADEGDFEISIKIKDQSLDIGSYAVGSETVN